MSEAEAYKLLLLDGVAAFAPAAEIVGIDIKELTSVLESFANRGINSQRAGNVIKQSFPRKRDGVRP